MSDSAPDSHAALSVGIKAIMAASGLPHAALAATLVELGSRMFANARTSPEEQEAEMEKARQRAAGSVQAMNSSVDELLALRGEA